MYVITLDWMEMSFSWEPYEFQKLFREKTDLLSNFVAIVQTQFNTQGREKEISNLIICCCRWMGSTLCSLLLNFNSA